MKVVTPGHEYILEGYGVSAGTNQTITFISKSGQVFLPGTTNEEVVSMLLERLHHQQSTNFSGDTQEAILCLKQAKRVLARRAEKKVKRKFNETSKKEYQYPGIQAEVY